MSVGTIRSHPIRMKGYIRVTLRRIFSCRTESGCTASNPRNRQVSTVVVLVPAMRRIRKELASLKPRAKDQRTLLASPNAVASSTTSPGDPAIAPDHSGSSKESGWRTAYEAAKMAIEIAKESSDMFPPLKAVAGVLSVLVKNYDVGPSEPASHSVDR